MRKSVRRSPRKSVRRTVRKSVRRSPRRLNSYQLFVKKHMKVAKFKAMSPKNKMRKIAALWRSSKK